MPQPQDGNESTRNIQISMGQFHSLSLDLNHKNKAFPRVKYPVHTSIARFKHEQYISRHMEIETVTGIGINAAVCDDGAAAATK